ncbi:MAG: ComF family protein [Planctomycetes bacterium]|nr:ComF family protein [Planctomycetota bacterium]
MRPQWVIGRRILREVTAGLRDLVLPPACLGCGGPAQELCPACLAGLRPRPEVGCRRCGEPLTAEAGRCVADHSALRGLAWHVAAFDFHGTGGALVRRFKLDANAAAGHCLARALSRRLGARLAGPWRRACLVPVPLHPSRRRERGFDQAVWLARQVSLRLGGRHLPVCALARRQATRPQGDPRVLSRERNVADAFVLRTSREVAGKPVVLLDDVFTSGATARACAALLRQAGATAVALATACRS